MNQPFLPTLYARGSGGAVLQWSIFVDGGSFWSEAGQVGGSITASEPTRTKGKNLGKKNETMPAQQAIIEAQAKWDKKKRENYFEDVADIDKGFPEPQLAKPGAEYMDKVVWSDGQLVDNKLNGWACIITRKGAFTRNNKQYHTIPHILEALAGIFQNYPDAYIQGELFNPAYVNNLGALTELVSVARQPKDVDQALLDESKRLVQFHWYDGYGLGAVNHVPVTMDTPLRERRQMIDLAVKACGSESIQSVPYTVCFSFEDMKAVAEAYIATGGEGVIVKNPKAAYQHKRTKDLLKYKKQEDAEYKVVDDVPNPFKEGKGNSTGCAESVWVFNPKGKRDEDKRCKINIEGPKDKLRIMYKQPERYKGQWITARFQELSPYNVPLIPYTDMVLREEVEGKGSVNAGEKEAKTSVAPVDFLSDEPKQDVFDL